MSALLKKKVFSDYFPVPEYLRLSNSGIAITDTEVKFLEFRHGRFSRFEKISLPEGVVQSGFINAPEKLIAILKDLALRYKLRYAYATLPEERAYLFTTIIDKVPEEGLRDSVAFIIEENVPVKLANSVFDFDVIEELKQSNQLKITVSVISKKVVDFYLQVFESAGITPVSFDIESQAIARAIIPRGDKSTQLIVHLGEKKTGFYVVEDEVVQWTTTLPYSAQTNTTNSHLTDLRTELRKIFAFWTTRAEKPGFSERKIEKMLICGPGALNGALVAEFTKECPVTCSITDPLINVPEAKAHLQQNLSAEVLNYASAIGLVLPNKIKSYA